MQEAKSIHIPRLIPKRLQVLRGIHGICHKQLHYGKPLLLVAHIPYQSVCQHTAILSHVMTVLHVMSACKHKLSGSHNIILICASLYKNVRKSDMFHRAVNAQLIRLCSSREIPFGAVRLIYERIMGVLIGLLFRLSLCLLFLKLCRGDHCDWSRVRHLQTCFVMSGNTDRHKGRFRRDKYRRRFIEVAFLFA